MGFRFRKTFSILPGIRVNMSKSGPSVSVGGKGLTTNFGRKGTKTTVGLPGSGMSYSSYKRYDKGATAGKGAPSSSPLRPGSLIPILLIAAVFYAIYAGGGLTHILKSKVGTVTDTLKNPPAPATVPAAITAFTVAPASAQACGMPFPCQLQAILDSSDWPGVSAALAAAIRAGADDRVDWTGTVPSRHGYVTRGKVLASGDCTSYAVAARTGGKTVIRHVKLCDTASAVPELK